ncbi:MAG TPA: VIT1/CCC1 transporter family protein [Solirubrobacteraceae bacterium]|nr:VIT1/CCC1 transporter family protein [Solirubrobacteraceae bacterium]
MFRLGASDGRFRASPQLTADELPPRRPSAVRGSARGHGKQHAQPAQSALPTGVCIGLSAIIPVIPLMFTTGTAAVVAAAIVSLVAHFLVRVAKSLVTLRKWWLAGLERTPAVLIVGGATYLVGLVLPA